MFSGFLVFAVWFYYISSWLLSTGVRGYIPALPSNDTSINFNGNASHLDMQWYGGGFVENVSYQLVGANSNGVSQGALVHFSEDKISNATNDTTSTPWIALVSCDGNATDSSDWFDIFTLAKERGAVSALLYSLYSWTCVINPAYADPANFDQLMDIFSTTSLTISQFIEYEFQSGVVNNTKYGHYDPGLLNASAAAVQTAINNGTVAKGFMFATLTAFNATAPSPSSPGVVAASPTETSSPGGPNTSLAMIILYAITGCVSALFCVVIISGAIRAIRHPERYGPRAMDGAYGGQPGGFGAAQSRARGLTRAILDTFPVVKFGRPEDEDVEHQKDIESSPDGRGHVDSPVEMDDLPEGVNADQKEGHGEREGEAIGEEVVPKSTVGEERRTSDDSQVASSSRLPSPLGIPRPRPSVKAQEAHAEEREIVPDAIGRETCPICIVDFEEGDDLRVLPCEGHHRFHQTCVDPWLLELSSSCPICRQDFHVLETMMNDSDGGDHLEPPHAFGSSRPLSTAGARFSRYIRMARRRRGRQQNMDGSLGWDPTNPDLPMAHETTL